MKNDNKELWKIVKPTFLKILVEKGDRIQMNYRLPTY